MNPGNGGGSACSRFFRPWRLRAVHGGLVPQCRCFFIARHVWIRISLMPTPLLNTTVDCWMQPLTACLIASDLPIAFALSLSQLCAMTTFYVASQCRVSLAGEYVKLWPSLGEAITYVHRFQARKQLSCRYPGATVTSAVAHHNLSQGLGTS